jgi:hypothetical protein
MGGTKQSTNSEAYAATEDEASYPPSFDPTESITDANLLSTSPRDNPLTKDNDNSVAHGTPPQELHQGSHKVDSPLWSASHIAINNQVGVPAAEQVTGNSEPLLGTFFQERSL